MTRETPKNIYIAKVTKFGNGAKIKAFKKHIDNEVIIMTQNEFNKQCKNHDLIRLYKQSMKDDSWTDKDDIEFDKLEKETVKKWIKQSLDY